MKQETKKEKYEYEDIEDGLINYYADKGKKRDYEKARKEFLEKQRDLAKRGFSCFKSEKYEHGVIRHYRKK